METWKSLEGSQKLSPTALNFFGYLKSEKYLEWQYLTERACEELRALL